VNTAERIVESYFRHCRDCFTITDVKMQGGNNRQLDLLAVNLKRGEYYHVETSVKIKGFDPTIAKLESLFDQKFLGAPRPSEKVTGDFSRGKNFYPAIKKTYTELGIQRSKLRRVFVCWQVKNATSEQLTAFLRSYSQRQRWGSRTIEIISFKDVVLPELFRCVDSANYSDDALRTLSLLKATPEGRRFCL
jgi:hypothetical protein